MKALLLRFAGKGVIIVKLFKNLLLTSMAMALTAGIPAVNASAFSITTTDISYSDTVSGTTNHYETLEAAAKYVRQAMKNREKEIDVSLPLAFIHESDFYDMIKIIISETNDGAEGDYIRTAIRSVQCSRVVDAQKCYFSFSITYNSTAEQEKYVTEKTAEILRNLNISRLDDYGKISAIYEYLINNVDYEYTADDNSCYTAYGALKNGKAVCQGYSQLFYRLVKDSGISCRVIFGSTTENHSWNIVAVNGLYYFCDSTYDIFSSKVENCNYLLKGMHDFDEYDHNTSHIMAQPDEENPLIEDYFSNAFRMSYPIAESAYMTKFSRGDVNGDSLIDSTDASLILSEYARMSTTGISGFSAEQKKAANVNGDDSVDSSDASAILSFYSYVSTGGTSSIEDYLRR